MKTITRILLLGLLLFPMCVFAQNATDKKNYEVRVEWEDLNDIEYVPYKVPIYYDDDDNVIKHGPFKVNYREDLTSRARQKCIVTYTASGNYVNGKLNGVLSLEETITVAAGVQKVKGTLNYVNGEPNGNWTFSELSTFKGKTATAKLVVIFKDNKLVSFDINDGDECFTINTSNNTFSGRTQWGEVYKNGVNISKFIRKTGEKTKPDENATNLINAFIAGTMTESDLIAKGFGFERKRPWQGYDFDNFDYYFSKLHVGQFTQGAVSTSCFDLIHSMKNNNEIAITPTYTLKRVNVISADSLVAKTSFIKTSKKIWQNDEFVSWNDNSNTEYHYTYKSNHIKISRVEYYFTDEAKLKLEEAIKVCLEERRLEEERQAEERRLEAERQAEERRILAERQAEEIRLARIERERKLFQPICDFLVSRKTATSISYDDEVYKYFNSEGLADYWRLDLRKAIKPFCKIVGCTLVSREGNVAVLDITKFNRKGNITYRVPVTLLRMVKFW